MLEQWVAALPVDQREVALQLLDKLSRPLSPREIEGSLRRHGVSKSRAVILGASLRKLHIIALVGPEEI